MQNDRSDTGREEASDETFADRLAGVRLWLGQSVYAFARHCGVNDAAMRKYLAGDTLPSFENLASISRATGVSLDWLIRGEEGVQTGRDSEALTRVIALAAEAVLDPLIKGDAPDGLYKIVAEIAVQFYRELKISEAKGGRGLDDVSKSAAMVRKIVLTFRDGAPDLEIGTTLDRLAAEQEGTLSPT